MSLKIIPFQSVFASTWSGGKTYQFYIYPEQSSYSELNFIYRISSATIDLNESTFTRFKGYKRYLVMLDNDLKVQHNKIYKVFNKHEVFEFDSQDEVLSYSKGTDFNFMIAHEFDKTQIKIAKGSYTTNSATTLLFALTNSNVSINGVSFTLQFKDLIVLNEPTSLELESDFIIIETIY